MTSLAVDKHVHKQVSWSQFKAKVAMSCMWTFHSCASLYPQPGGETRPQSSARQSGWGTALSFSTLPWQNGFQPPLTITPPCQRAAWEVREKSHTVMPEQTGKACCSSQCFTPAQDRQGWRDEGGTGEERGEGWVTSLFFHLVFNWPLSAFTRVKCSLCVGHQVQRTLSTVSWNSC